MSSTHWNWCSPLCRWHPTVWPLFTWEFFWVGFSSSSSYWLNSRVDVLKPAFSLNTGKTQFIWLGTKSCQERNRSALQSTSVPQLTYIRVESWLHYRSRVKHEGHITKLCQTCYYQLHQIRTVRPFDTHLHHQPSKLWSMPSSARESISLTAFSMGQVSTSLTVSNRS